MTHAIISKTHVTAKQDFHNGDIQVGLRSLAKKMPFVSSLFGVYRSEAQIVNYD